MYSLRDINVPVLLNSNNKTYQVRQQHNHPIELSTSEMMGQRLDYLHENPIQAGFVDDPEGWLHSSAKNMRVSHQC